MSRPLLAVSLGSCQSPVPEVSVPSKILPLPQHCVLDGIDVLSWHPIDPVVRGFSRTQLEGLEDVGKEEQEAQN